MIIVLFTNKFETKTNVDKAISEAQTVNALQHYYEKQETATRECLIALKSIVLSIDSNIIHKRKYQIPFFCYNEFNLGFLWVHKKKIIVGFIEDKKEFSDNRKTFKRQRNKMIEHTTFGNGVLNKRNYIMMLYFNKS